MSASTATAEREFAFSESEFRFLSDWAYRHTGIVLADHKRDMVYSRLVRRLRALSLNSFHDYCELLKGPQGEEEVRHMVNAITTNLTSFFRERHHFDHLQEYVATMPRGKRLRIWSAACSSGMEPYSIALTLRATGALGKDRDTRILATDIDTNMLQHGRAGVYPAGELENIPAGMRGGIAKEGEKIRLPEELRESIAFNHLNLLGDWPMKGPFDAVFCRNVVIYFDKPTQKKLFNRIADLTQPGGWLYIGHSENLNNLCDRFEPLGRTIYRRTT